jgi:hypothetical protein
MDWFSVDKEGLARLMERKGKPRMVLELVQNALDEAGVTTVSVELSDHPKRGRSVLVVEDDAPAGFADLSHAFTIFAPSTKVADAGKRGRFNMGDKLTLAICDSATVTSTTGGYQFDQTGRKALRTRRAAGSRFEAVIRMTAVERGEVEALMRSVIIPDGVTVTFNGEPLAHRVPVMSFTATLRTEVADAEGILRPTRRQTTVRLFDPVNGEAPSLFEMGIPVVEIPDGRWHVDIGQKVPLGMDRDSVPPSYMRDVSVTVLNAAHDLLTVDDAATGWVKQAVGDDRVESSAVRTVINRRFGDRVVGFVIQR